MEDLKKDDAIRVNAQVIKYARQEAESKPCKKCKSRDRSVVALNEYGDPYLASQVTIFCKQCKDAEVFALRPKVESQAYAKFIMKKERTDIKVMTADKMIEYAKYHKQIADMLHGEEAKAAAEKVIKDEAGKIIMNPEDVKKIDAKIRKKNKR